MLGCWQIAWWLQGHLAAVCGCSFPMTLVSGLYVLLVTFLQAFLLEGDLGSKGLCQATVFLPCS